MLWAVFTVIAAAAQTARNAMQRELTATLGTVGATHVRFLFGFPFAILFLIGVCVVTDRAAASAGLVYWPWIVLGFMAQIAATAMMLAAMNDRSFVVTIAYIKTEPVQVALFGLILLGDKVTPLLALAIVIATAGVVVMSLKPGAAQSGGFKPTLMGSCPAACSGCRRSAIAAPFYRSDCRQFRAGGDLHADGRAGLPGGAAVGLAGWRDPKRAESDLSRPGSRRWWPASWARSPRNSGFWLLRLPRRQACARLALVEGLFAQGISKFVFKQPTNAREIVGIVHDHCRGGAVDLGALTRTPIAANSAPCYIMPSG